MSVNVAEFDGNWLQRFRRNVTRWYAKNARDLPWRNTNEAYRIWLSEIMLQQTTVAAVIPYFERFLSRFPDVQALSAATEDDVLRYWEGLGYYSRARNIHRTARLISQKFDGRFPDDVSVLIKLPGIGRYTAGAIASFAFDRRAPIVEANTLRLYSRLLGFRGDPHSTQGQRVLWQFAEDILPRKSPGTFNQALMELGATVCTPNDPQCKTCPVRSCCQALADGTISQIPRPKVRAAVTELTEASLAIDNGGCYLLLKRQPGERWAGLWDFPRFEVNGQLKRPGKSRPQKPADVPGRVRYDLERQLAESTGIKAKIGRLISEIRHSVTRYRIHLLCIHADYEAGAVEKPAGEFRWVTPAEFDELALSMTGRKLAQMLLHQETDVA